MPKCKQISRRRSKIRGLIYQNDIDVFELNALRNDYLLLNNKTHVYLRKIFSSCNAPWGELQC